MCCQLFFGFLCAWLWTTTVASVQLSRDFVTYRYYGRRTDNFKQTQGYPLDSWEVCSTFYSVCVDIRLNECVRANPEMRAPYTRQVTDRDPGRYVFEPPKARIGGYMMISDVDMKYEADSSGLTLWSGCDEFCNDCKNATGSALYPLRLPMMCGAMEEGDVFSMYWNSGDGTVDTRRNCVDSLAAYWDKVEAARELRTVISVSVVGGLMFCGGAWALFFWFYYRRKRENAYSFPNQLDINRMNWVPGVHGLEWRDSQLGRSIIGQVQIEEQFPVVSVTDQPQCVVCLLSVQASDSARRFQCSHVFHADCISQWWLHTPRSNLECPVCKQPQKIATDKQADLSTTAARPTVVGAALPDPPGLTEGSPAGPPIIGGPPDAIAPTASSGLMASNEAVAPSSALTSQP